MPLKELFNHHLIQSALVILVCIILYFISMSSLKKAIKRSKIDVNFHHFLISLSKISLLLLVLIISFAKLFRIPFSALLTSFGFLGLAASLAIKDSLANLASGGLLLLTKPFGVNNYIRVDTAEGHVIEVGLIYTKLSTIDNKIVSIPNNTIAKEIVINYSDQTSRCLEMLFLVGYDSDLALAKQCVANCVLASHLAMDTPEPLIAVHAWKDSGLEIILRVWCENSNYFPLKYHLNESVKAAFDTNNITIPYPIVMVKNDNNIPK